MADSAAALPIVQKKSQNPTLAIYLEPTDLNIYTAQMGFQIVEVVVHQLQRLIGLERLLQRGLAIPAAQMA